MKIGYMKRAVLAPAIALGLIVAVAAPTAAAQSPAPRKVALRDQSNLALRAAAEAGLRRMMLELASGQAAQTEVPQNFPLAVDRYGDLRKLSLGAGFEVNTIDPASLLYAGRGADLGRMSRGTDVWKFVIALDGRPVGLLEMNKVQGQWQAVGAGAAKLAEEVVAAAPMTGDGAFRFVRIYQATSDLIEVRGAGGGSRFVPMQSARRSLALDPSQGGTQARKADAAVALGTRADAAGPDVALTSEDLLPSLQTAVRGNLQRGQR